MSGAPTSPFEVVLDIDGMTCASCVDRIERVLRGQGCVVEANVSLAARSAVVKTTLRDPAPLITAVRTAGYGATLRERRSALLDEANDYQHRLIVSAFCSFYVLLFSLLLGRGTHASAVAGLLFATPIQFYGGWPFLRNAARAARHGTHTMDTLIACGSLAAYTYSAAIVLAASGTHQVYFDTAAMIVTLVLLGKTIESRARARARGAARLLLDRQATEATVLDHGTERRVPVDHLQAGDRVVALPGETVPADGTVESGHSSVDLSMITGESLPVDVGPGADVVGGSLNGPGRLVIVLTRVGAETRLAQIVRLLERTQTSKAPIQRVADRVAAVFVPWVLALAGTTVFIRLFFDSVGLGAALMYGAAVLLVACPCSVGLATPAAIMSGAGRAAELGVLFKGGEVFEAARHIDMVLFDKTGTLTEGRMALREVKAAAGEDVDRVLSLAAAAEAGSEHPIARCVQLRAKDRGIAVPEATGHVAEPGRGITASVAGARIRVGRPDGLSGALAERAERFAAGGLTVFAVWEDERAVGLLGAADRVRPDAAQAVLRLRCLGWDVQVVSGDRRSTVERVAREVGIDLAVSEVLPEGKVEEIRRIQATGRRVAFVGDGVNDAPALAQADLGIALKTGTDVAREAGDVLILGSDIGLVVDCLVLARKTFWVIAQNLGWAFAYNTLMIPLAVVGVVSPMVAAGAMAGSSVTVVANALRLRAYARGRERAPADAEVDGAGPVPVASAPPSIVCQPAGHPVALGGSPGTTATPLPAPRAPSPALNATPTPQGSDGSVDADAPLSLLRETLTRLADFVTGKWAEPWDA